MSTVIDEFVAVFTIDPKGFQDGAQEVRMEVKRTREAAGSATAEMGAYSKRISEFFKSARNEAVGLFLAFQGASSLKGFITDLLTGDAATARLAGNLGLATNELSAWQLAVKEAGGTAEDANAALGIMANAFQSWKLTGTTGNDNVFKSLGITYEDLQDPTRALYKLAEAAEKLPKTEFYAKAKMLGIPDSVIVTLEKGRGAVEKLVEAKKLNGAASDEDAAAAERLQAKLNDLQAHILKVVRPGIYKLVEVLEDTVQGFEDGTGAAPEFNLALAGIATAATLAGAPFVALAAAITLVIANWEKLEKLWSERNKGDQTNKTIDFLQKMGLVGGAPVNPGAPPSAPGNAPSRGGPTGSVGDRKARIQSQLRAAGFSDEQVRGILAGMTAENATLDPNVRGGYKGRAVGIGQWLGPRRDRLLSRFGASPTLDQQIQFMIEELRGGDKGGASVRAQTSAEATMVAYLRDFMRPGAGLGPDIQRGYAALGIRRPQAGAAYAMGGASNGGTVTTNIGTLVVNTAATDAQGIARDLPGQLQRRGIVTQANRGLN